MNELECTKIPKNCGELSVFIAKILSISEGKFAGKMKGDILIPAETFSIQ